MAELTETIVGETELIVREGRVDIELLLGCHSDLKFVLGACVSNNLPIVNSVRERPV